MVEHLLGRDAGVDAEILRQVAEHPAQSLRLLEDIDVAEPYLPGGRGLQGGDDAHQGRLASAVGAQKAVHALGDGQADIVERLHAAGVDVRQSLDGKHAGPFYFRPLAKHARLNNRKLNNG